MLVNHKFRGSSVQPGPAPEQPADEIWYISGDGNVITPSMSGSSVFGANIVSNTYSDGKGVIKFDGDVTRIGEQAFSDATGLTAIYIPTGVTEIAHSALCNTAISIILIPSGVTEIGNYAFQDCHHLTRVRIPNAVTSVGTSAFYRCVKLKTVQLGTGLTAISERMLERIGIASIVIPNNITAIEEAAFRDCLSLTSVNIPDSVASIGAQAFMNCQRLQNTRENPYPVHIGSGVASIGSNAFAGIFSLNALDYRGTMAQWAEIEKDKNALPPYLIAVHCTDGDIYLN